MNKERSSYRHPQHDSIAALLTTGVKDIMVAKRLGVSRRAVARVRDIIGMKAYTNTNSSSIEAKLAKFSTSPDDDGHIRWTGRTSANGCPEIRHLNVPVPATHVAFEQHTGRVPSGPVMSNCGVRHCLNGAHLWDETERTTGRMFQRALAGLEPEAWSICPQGIHPWSTDGRLNPDLSPYCKSCTTERTTRLRAVRTRSRIEAREDVTA
jgi:hypothetical protein